MIPKIINYCWFGGSSLPIDVKKCIKSWERMCPEYEIKRWDESNFDVNAHPFTKAAYAERAWAFVSDYARLKIIYDNGGIYLDTDVELLKNLDPLLKYQCYLGIQQLKHLCNTGLGFGATKFNPVVGKMLKKYDYIKFNGSKTITCPHLNNKVLNEIGYSYDEKEPVIIDGTLILPPKYIDPFPPGASGRNLMSEETFSIHHYSASWKGNMTAFRRRIVIMIGQEKVRKAKIILGHILKIFNYTKV